MSIQILPAYDRLETIRVLFSEYTELLIAGDPSFQEYLDLQHYDSELEQPLEKYGLPHGRLYIALWDEIPAGCIALRRIDEECCEMKRLYVRPALRKRGIGSQLIQQILSDARAIGYRRMLLDTLPFLEQAIDMYRKIGFSEIPIYNDSPMTSALYMSLNL